MADSEPSPNRIDPHLEVRERRTGSRPGDRYVRIVRPFETEFERGEGGELVATSETLVVPPGWQRTLAGIRSRLIGKPISSEQEVHERLT